MAAASLFQSVIDVDGGSLQGGRDPETDAGEQSGRKQEKSRAQIDGDGLHAWNIWRAQRDQRARSQNSQSQPQSASHRAEQKAFGQELTKDASAASAQSGAYGHFSLPRCRPRQEHVSHIRAGDEQDKGNGCEQHKQRSLDRTHNFFFERRYQDIAVGAGELPFQALGDSRDFRASLLQRDAVFQSRKNPQAITAAVVNSLAKSVWHTKLVTCGPEGRELESLRHHADDNVRVSIQDDGLSEHVAIGGKSALPQAVAQDDFAVGTVFVLALDKQASKQRVNSEHGEKTLGHLQAGDVFRRIDAGEVGRPVIGCAHGGERMALVAPVNVVRNRNGIIAIHQDG